MAVSQKEYIDAVQKWGDEQIAEAVAIIKNANASNTGNLADSLRFEIKEVAEGILLQIYDAPYSDFVRLGVKGSISNAKAPNSPFSYKDKMPPAGPITKWAIQKGISGTRNAKGQFIKRKSLIYAIRVKIFRFGFRPLNFYSSFSKI